MRNAERDLYFLRDVRIRLVNKTGIHIAGFHRCEGGPHVFGRYYFRFELLPQAKSAQILFRIDSSRHGARIGDRDLLCFSEQDRPAK